MKKIVTNIVLIFLLNSCSGQTNINDKFIQSSKDLINSIRDNDTSSILKLVNEHYFEKSVSKSMFRNYISTINYYLDSVTDINNLTYNIEINKSNLFDFAIVTVPLKNEEHESFEIRIFFSDPYINPQFKIRYFDFDKKTLKFKFESHPTIKN